MAVPDKSTAPTLPEGSALSLSLSLDLDEAVTVTAAPEREEEIDTVRPDRNLEKWPIWQAGGSRLAPTKRTIQREVRLPDGSKAVAKVEVGYSDKGMLTTEDQKTLYALVKHWEERGKPGDDVVFSKQQIARVLKKTWGRNVNAALTESLMRLRFTPFTWERSYFDSAAKETVGRIDTFTILTDLHLTYRKDAQKHTTREACHYRFNDRILQNLLSGFTRPVFLDTVLSFKSEISQVLYSHLDLVLSDKNHYERRTKELCEDLGFDGPAYKYPSKRAQLLEPALQELQGQPLPTGLLKEVRLEKTVDGKDFKIVVRKIKGKPGRPKVVKAEPALSAPVVTALTPGMPAEKATPRAKAPACKADTAAAAKEAAIAQVRHFHQVFFRATEIAPPSAKEVQKAQDHLERLGEEKARYLVTFALRAAKDTNFDIQTYGGIAQYEARAMAEYDEDARLRQGALLRKARTGHQERFAEAYRDYLTHTLREREEGPSARFKAFLTDEESYREKYRKGPLAGHAANERVLRDYDQEEARLKRFAAFFADDPEEPVLDFWAWDATLSPSPFSPPSGSQGNLRTSEDSGTSAEDLGASAMTSQRAEDTSQTDGDASRKGARPS